MMTKLYADYMYHKNITITSHKFLLTYLGQFESCTMLATRHRTAASEELFPENNWEDIR